MSFYLRAHFGYQSLRPGNRPLCTADIERIIAVIRMKSDFHYICPIIPVISVKSEAGLAKLIEEGLMQLIVVPPVSGPAFEST
jgi:hypothetical protein